jgi:hypothetical protein
MSTHFIFPKPRDWNAFEDIVCDVFSRKLGNYNLQRYGRSGQKQSGVDIAGLTADGILGIQCKHHPSGIISKSEIDGEISKSEGFLPQLCKFIITTSADRDARAHQHVLNLSDTRKNEGKYPIGIMFWEDIYNLLVEFPDLVYKHFTKYFPVKDLEHIQLPGIHQSNKTTIRWPITFPSLKESIEKTMGSVDKIDPYKLTVGLTSFPNTGFHGIVDLEIDLSDLFSSEVDPEESFIKSSDVLNKLKGFTNKPFFSKELLVHLQARLTLSFLLGWVFRRVSHYDLKLIFSDQVWATSGLPLVPSGLTPDLPIFLDQSSNDIVLVFEISRKISPSAIEFIGTWENQPKVVLIYGLDSSSISSAAHALSLSIDISFRIKSIIDKWGAHKIHLFGAMPAALATLISYHLNAICPISIYFMDHSRKEYRLGGTLVNDL